MDPVTATILNGLESGVDREAIVQTLTSQYRLTRQQALEAISIESGESDGDIIEPRSRRGA